MDIITVVRFLHIMSAIFWVGTTLFMLFFLEPTVERLGPPGAQVMAALASSRLSQAMSLSGIVTVGAGLTLYWQTYGLHPAVLLGPKLPLTLGALAGFLAVFVGFYFQGASAKALSGLGATIAAQGHPPTPEQQAQVQAHQARIQRGTRFSALLMVLAVVGMVA